MISSLISFARSHLNRLGKYHVVARRRLPSGPATVLTALIAVTTCTAILVAAPLLAQDYLHRVPLELDFGQDVENPNFMTAREIEIRGRNLNLLLLPDHPGRNLQDFRAEGIPASGMEFELRAPGQGRVYLYLDLVSFQPMENAVPRKVRWMEIFVNGHLLRTVHEGGGAFVQGPLALLIEREHAIHRRLQVRLRPSPGDGFFAIWDAYVSRHAPDDGDD